MALVREHVRVCGHYPSEVEVGKTKPISHTRMLKHMVLVVQLPPKLRSHLEVLKAPSAPLPVGVP